MHLEGSRSIYRLSAVTADCLSMAAQAHAKLMGMNVVEVSYIQYREVIMMVCWYLLPLYHAVAILTII